MLENINELLNEIKKFKKAPYPWTISGYHTTLAEKAQKEVNKISGAIPIIQAILLAHGPTSQPRIELRIAIEKAEDWLETYEEKERK